MATIELTTGSSGNTVKGVAALYGKPVKTIYKIVDLTTVQTAKGSTLATNDVVQTVAIPANSVLAFPRVVLNEAADINAAKISVGVTGSTTNIVQDGSIVGTLGFVQNGGATALPSFIDVSTYSTINVTLASFSSTAPTTGQFVIHATVIDMNANDGQNVNKITPLGGVTGL
jgi:hypothetical protein